MAITVVVKGDGGGGGGGALRNRPRCNIKAQQEKLLLKRQLWDWLECGVIDRLGVCFKRGGHAGVRCTTPFSNMAEKTL